MSNKIISVATENKELDSTKLVSELSATDTADTLSSTIDMIKQEYGDLKLTRKMKKEISKELGVDEDSASGWQTMTDVLDHIDMVELAKRHPETIAKIAKKVASIVSVFIPAVGAVSNAISNEGVSKIVGIAGMATPEHILNVIAKKQAERKRNKKLPAEAESTETMEEVDE